MYCLYAYSPMTKVGGDVKCKPLTDRNTWIFPQSKKPCPDSSAGTQVSFYATFFSPISAPLPHPCFNLSDLVIFVCQAIEGHILFNSFLP